MTPGMQITAWTSNGPITVTAVDDLRRIYCWDGASRSVELIPRELRWNGSLGIYFPGPGNHWSEHNGIARCVVEEGQQHFSSQDEALKWLQKMCKRKMPIVYTGDGLVVRWTKILPRKQLSVDVFQLYVNGKKPSALPGSTDDSITITQVPMSEVKRLYARSDLKNPIPLPLQFLLAEPFK
ncbi:MAG: hypothetical protein K8F91_19260 [Candidatus Obscuribacterales bacterium]|nr:hypothetical protein [Candidatus Obscuribacterales bacterium]